MEVIDLDAAVITRLAPWKGAILLWIRGELPELTSRQFALLMIVCLEPGQHPVRSLALRLNVAKPIICRVLDRLFELGLIIRETGRRDHRDVFAVATPRGLSFLTKFDAYLAPLFPPQ